MTTPSVSQRGILGPHFYEDVPFHEHDFSEISGELIISEAQITSLSASKITAGTINAHTITIDTGGVLESADFVTGPAGAGWQLAAGLAEFNNITVRGTIFSGTGSQVDWTHLQNVSVVNADIVSLAAGKITAGTINGEIIVLGTAGGSGIIESGNFVGGSAGFRIRGAGDAEFSDVTVRGEIVATSGDFAGVDISGTLTMIGSGKIRTAASGNRIELLNSAGEQIKMYSSTALALEMGAVTGTVSRILGKGDLSIQAAGILGLVANAAGEVWSLQRTGTIRRMRVGDLTTSYMQFDSAVAQWKFHIAGTDEIILGSTGFLVPNVFNSDFSGGSTVFADSGGRLHINTSSLARKTKVTRPSDFADVALVPIRYRRKGDTSAPFEFSYAAEELGEQRPELVTYDAEGKIHDFRDRGVLAILGAKANRADDEREELRLEVDELRERLESLEQLLQAA